MNTIRVSAFGVACVAFLGSCADSPEPMPVLGSPASPEPANGKVAIPAPGSLIRVGGDRQATVTGGDGDYRAGSCRIDTPLPVGYPGPTPSGAIDLKTYPAVRRAEVRGQGTPDQGMNRAFWPLFDHIKGHDIAMTSPVEMEYRGPGGAAAADDWSMAFLYRTSDLNGTGEEGVVTVRDSDPVTVVSVGLRGTYSMALVRKGVEQIEGWLAANPQWEAAGDWRSLYYNGPALRWWNKWAEVQLPVQPRGDEATADDGKGGDRP